MFSFLHDEKACRKIEYILLLSFMGVAAINILFVVTIGLNINLLAFGLVGISTIIYTVATAIIRVKKGLVVLEIYDRALLAMLIWSVAATVLSDDIRIAFSGSDYRNDGLYTYLVYAAIYVCARRIESDRYRENLVMGFCMMVSMMSLVSVSQRITGYPGVPQVSALYAAGLSNTNHFAYLLCMAIVAAGGLTFRQKNICAKAIALLSIALNMWALIENETMGSYIAAIIGIIFLICIMSAGERLVTSDALLVVATILLVNVATVFDNGILRKNFLSIFKGIEIGEGGLVITDSAGSSRIGLWRQSIKYIFERPVFGFGPEGLVKRFYEDGFFNDRPHNEYLQHAVFLGLPGLFMYLTALLSMFIRKIRRIKNLELIELVIGSIVLTYCASAFFGNTMYYTSCYFFMILGLCGRENRI